MSIEPNLRGGLTRFSATARAQRAAQRIARLVLLLAITASCSTSPELPTDALPESDAIRAAFQSYRRAILNDDGETAASLVASPTLRYYERMRKLSLRASRIETESLAFGNEFIVLISRSKISAQELREMDGRSYIVYAVEHGWVGKQSVMGLEPGKIQTLGDTAVLHASSSSGKGTIPFTLLREEGKWKIDLVPSMTRANVTFRALARQQGVSEDELLRDLLEAVLGSRPADALWDPLEPESGG